MNIIIGIDPDVKESGFCIWDAGERVITELAVYDFFALLDRLRYYTLFGPGEVTVIIDAGWLNKSNFHARSRENHRVNAQIGERTGANHEVGKKISEMCVYLGLDYQLHKPTRHKVDADDFRKITGHEGRTNQEMRDAAMCVFGL